MPILEMGKHPTRAYSGYKAEVDLLYTGGIGGGDVTTWSGCVRRDHTPFVAVLAHFRMQFLCAT
jgi:hypothetical protein